MEMRRKDRQITEVGEILAILNQCKVCRLAMVDEGTPYIVPLNFGYTFAEGRLVLYFHSAKSGRKIDILRKNNSAVFEVDCEHRLVEGDIACEYGFAFASVIGFGKISFLETKEEKIHGLNALMKHQTGTDREFHYEDARLMNVAVYKLAVGEFSAKRKVLPKKQ
ncbi:MAG: pyridoxamine 5'-phosphate oxidase family protein [Fusobacteriaceae bacterium]|jgi:nitroimidazol reductase NimA-like FMN-containing flavoprotein (pyridoxamine 5'-phosphate oxidase superfamily)|nr:pyridoxamine 5'-phosphate oxidase family protein [Fusobacteriaceae bacterium]